MTSDNLNLCLIPLEIFWENKEHNISMLERKFAEIHPETDLVIVPETFSTGFPTGVEKEDIRELAEKNTGETIERLKELSRKYNVAIAGSFIADSGGLLFNRAFFIEPSGDEYFADKRHLFAPGGENEVFTPGDKRLRVRFRGWNIAMVVCYDLRFPVWCRNVDNEYDLLIAIANWPVARIAVWDTLLQARALENLAYVCGVNCRGIDKHGHDYNGSSAVFDFKGKDLTVKVSDDGLLYSSLSRHKLETFREKFPAWKDADKFDLIID